MFPRKGTRLIAAMVISTLLLAAVPALAAPGALNRGTHRGLRTAWAWLVSGSWISTLIKETLDEGSSIDPLGGHPKTTEGAGPGFDPNGLPKTTLDEGPGFDPDGKPKATPTAGPGIDPLGSH